MLFKIPIALINTTKLVLPALINGSGTPVGGIEQDTTYYCSKEIIYILLM